MIRIISKKTAGKPAAKTAKPTAVKSASKTSAKPKGEALEEVRKPDPDMPDALNRLDPKVEANAAKARDEHAEELRRQHAAGADKAKADAEKVIADAATRHAGTAVRLPPADTKAKGRAAKPAAGSRKGPNIGSIAREAILAGASNEDALKAVMKAFPNCSSNLGCMAWYRNKLRRDGLLPKAERGKRAT